MRPAIVPFFLCLVLLACSPESRSLNSAQKRDVAQMTEERAIPLLDSLRRGCTAYQDSLQPYLVDSIMQVRLEDIRQRLESTQ